MVMYSSFFREQKRHTLSELFKELNCSEEVAINILHKLIRLGIIQVVKATLSQKNMSELTESDVEVVDIEADNNEYFYLFTFVGVIILDGHVIKCYPKYLINKVQPKAELTLVLKVLEKFKSKRHFVEVFDEISEDRPSNLLAIMLFLIRDYYENGLYSNTENIVEINGAGEILWDKTINETFTYLSNNKPYYPELLTRKRVNNETDYFKRLHECVLTIVSNEMKSAELLELFEFSEIDLTDEELKNFGDTEYILYHLEKELSTQFNTRKQLVLKALYAYLGKLGSTNETNNISVFGTNSFNLVWEDVCAVILDNQLTRQLSNIPIPTGSLNKTYNPSDELINIIEKPCWTITGENADKTLIPDLITINDTQFIIFDAKYYTPILEPGKKPKHQPGIESVTKQYLYQLAYQPFIDAHKFTDVKNCFLMPTEKEEVQNKGTVVMKMFRDLNLTDIEVRYIPATTAYRHYLSGTTMDINELKL